MEAAEEIEQLIEALKQVALTKSIHSDYTATGHMAAVAIAREVVEKGGGVAGEIERLRAIVDKLPKTADGVPIIPGQTIVWVRLNGTGEWVKAKCHWSILANNTGSWVMDFTPRGPEHSYSTREAAEAAAND